jgi:hypothetical protein
MKRLLLLLLIVGWMPVRGQDGGEVTGGFSRIEGPNFRKTFADIGLGTMVLTMSYDFYNTWWKGAEKPFSFFDEHWFRDGQLGLDKAGHIFGPYCFSKIVRNMMLWAGYDKETAMWWSAAIGIWNGLGIEIGDGFSPYGFDYQDLGSDIIGVAFGLIQFEVPFLQNFTPKFSYWSQKGIASPANFTSDYDAMTIWMTFNVHNLLPNSINQYWPEFLQLAVGVGVADGVTRHKFAIGLDFNLSAFKTDSRDILFAQRLVEVVHLPAPAVKIVEGKSPVYQGFYMK